MAVTLKNVAARAGVSKSAVSRTFTEGASVSARMRRKVLAAANDLGYRPSIIASSLTTKRTKLIGLVANNFHNPIFMVVFDLFTAGLQERGLRPLLVNMTNESDPLKSVDLLLRYSVDGVIVASSTLPPSFAASFQKAGIPVIHTFGKYDSAESLHVVGIDNYRCGAIAADTMVARGYRSVAMLGGPSSASSTMDRVEGFRARAEAVDLTIATIEYADDYTYQAGRAAMRALLGRDDVEAVFCGDDVICMGAMDAARAAGRSIPDELGFLGFNDMPMASWSGYDLTTIRQPIQEMIVSAVELMAAIIENPER
ncbi:MAG: LacI family DNA-binding transcriptional regulator, partial [Alphaproteobacteria bacterium]